MVRYKPYERYKDSGVEWIGKIPEHWDVKPLKSAGKFVSGTGFPHEYQGLAEELYPFFKVDDTNLPGNELYMNNHTNSVSEKIAKQLGAKVCDAGTVIFPKVGAALLKNKRRILTRPSIFDNNMMGLVIGQDKPEYIAGCLSLVDFGQLCNPGPVPSINERQLSSLPMLFPSLHEQQAITNFLVHKTSEIDNLIADKEKLITLLQEYRQAVISEAVTKGLDPNVKMKDSGIEWIGEIPEHWEILPTKRLFKIVNGATPNSNEPDYWDGDILWVTPIDLNEIHGNVIIETKRRITVEGYYSCGTTLVPPGSIIISTRAPIGYIALAGNPLCTNQGCKSLVKKIKSLSPSFFYYFFLAARNELQAWGMGTTFVELSNQSLSNLPICVPTYSEQQAIADYLDQKTSEIDSLISGIQDSIEQLKAYRQSLISEAVTGKIDVREFAAEGGAASGQDA